MGLFRVSSAHAAGSWLSLEAKLDCIARALESPRPTDTTAGESSGVASPIQDDELHLYTHFTVAWQPLRYALLINKL